MSRVMFYCPVCGRTILHTYPNYYEPNTICNCAFPVQVTGMVKVPMSDPVPLGNLKIT
jgi:hypothetical protein